MCIFVLLILVSAILQACALSSNKPSAVLVVGATGSMGKQALDGLLDVGYDPSQLRIVSRNKEKLKDLEREGFGICQADLDNTDSLKEAVIGCSGCYIHSTSSDTKKLDEKEVERARNLAKAIVACGDDDTVQHVVFNSAAAEPELCGPRKKQKQTIEDVFLEDYPQIKFTSLRANLFMDELWKKYTRPDILKGSFNFCVPPDRPIYLTSVRDMGRLAGRCLQSPETTRGRKINVAGDVLTPVQMADAFAKAQGTPCKHSQSRMVALLSRIFFRSLWDEIYFLRKTITTTDIQALTAEFPKSITSFEEFLKESNWSDSNANLLN